VDSTDAVDGLGLWPSHVDGGDQVHVQVHVNVHADA
jgi:hypothetical protein